MVMVIPESIITTRTALPPLIVTVCPLPSSVKFLSMVMVALSVIVPLQEKLTVSPGDAAAIVSTSRDSTRRRAIRYSNRCRAAGTDQTRLPSNAVRIMKRKGKKGKNLGECLYIRFFCRKETTFDNIHHTFLPS